ncbi:putative RNA helicase [Tieghemostelium lacteum]|uniref:Putative RNA helicase n=1 Tax=Tieghemostelium lacteum TaxID=361077 RepID=A0A152A970_TIELA|nr:putative RNA helicase [Tieghemostelium lacteum]|eukprot:KYR02768.1 putative RNA helicase [Tieghemostelium lacteum]
MSKNQFHLQISIKNGIRTVQRIPSGDFKYTNRTICSQQKQKKQKQQQYQPKQEQPQQQLNISSSSPNRSTNDPKASGKEMPPDREIEEEVEVEEEVMENWQEIDWASDKNFQEVYHRTMFVVEPKKNYLRDFFFFMVVYLLVKFCCSGIKIELGKLAEQWSGEVVQKLYYLDSIPDGGIYRELSFVSGWKEQVEDIDLSTGCWTAKYSYKKLTNYGVVYSPATPKAEAVSLVLNQVQESVLVSIDTTNEIGSHLVVVSKMNHVSIFVRIIFKLLVHFCNIW